MEYHNIDGTGWPDAVVVDNGGGIFEHAYETRTYFPVDRNALLTLAEEMDEATCDKRGEMSVSLGDVWGWAECIHEALGVQDA